MKHKKTKDKDIKMATYTTRAHSGLTAGYSPGVQACVDNLVKQAAEGAPYNLLGSAPEGFDPVEVTSGKSTTVHRIHAKSGVEFKSGFLMEELEGSQKWESHASVPAYRLDLQGIENGWANWAIQTNGKNSKTVATCLMEVNKSFGQRHLVHALKMSALNTVICELTQ